MIVGLLLVGLDAVAQLLVPALVRSGIDNGVTAHSQHTLLVISAVALGAVLADWVIEIAGQLITGRTGERLLYLLRVKTFAQLQRLGLDYYERELGGRIMTRMTTDIDALSNFLQTGLTTALISVLTLVGVLIALIVLDVQLSLILIVMLPFLIGSTYAFRRLAVPAYVEARERISTVNAQFQENVAGVRVTQAFGREGRNSEQFLGSSMSYRDSRLRAQRYISIYFPFVQFLSDIAGAAVLGFGAVRLEHGTLTAGALIAYFLYLDAFFSPVQQLSQVFDGYQQSTVGLSRLRDLLHTMPSTPAAEHPVAVRELRGADPTARRPLRLRRSLGRGAARCITRRDTGRDRCPRRADRCRQVDGRQDGRPLLRPHVGRGARRREGSAHARSGRVPPPARDRPAGGVPLARHGARRDRLWPAWRHERRGRGGREGGRRPRDDRDAHRGVSRARRRARPTTSRPASGS